MLVRFERPPSRSGGLLMLMDTWVPRCSLALPVSSSLSYCSQGLLWWKTKPIRWPLVWDGKAKDVERSRRVRVTGLTWLGED